MAENSLFWGGTTIGDCGPYNNDEFSDFITKLLLPDRTTEGILIGVDNELAVTNPAGLTISVDTGAALVDGKLYENTAAWTDAVVAPVSGINYYTLVLRKDFSLQTVRLELLAPSLVGYPTPTQTDGITWEIIVAHIKITDASVITIGNDASYCEFGPGFSGVRLIQTTDINLPNNTDTAVSSYDSEDYDVGGFYSAGSEIVIPKSGYYGVGAFSRVDGAGTVGTKLEITIIDDTAAVITGYSRGRIGASDYLNTYTELYLTVGKTLEVHLFQISGAALTIAEGAFWVTRLK
jgi:hypothetical protein